VTGARPTDGDEEVLNLEALGLLTPGHGDHHPVAAHFGALGRGIGHRADAAAGKGLLKRLPDFLILEGDERGQELDHGHLAAERAEGAGELHTDRPRPQDGDRCRDAFQ
jgi:hypothetical protein